MMSELYGSDAADARMDNHSDSPRPISECLGSVLSDVCNETQRISMRISVEWEDIVGKALSGLAVPERLDGKVLLLRVRHSALVQELQPSLPDFVNKINKHFETQVCDSIRLIC
ncbi:MAG: DUF721 domain-containing protein [Victivallaceae bacterium]|nr:DUF721 domain-containing protein [Victivallaceae bacterium]